MISRRRLLTFHRSRRIGRRDRGPARRRPRLRRRARSAGCRRAAPSRCSTTIPTGSAKKFGYFGDIETTLEPGPSDATATVKLVDQNQADMGYPSPGVFSLASRRASRWSRSSRWAVRRVRLRLPQGRGAEGHQGPGRQDDRSRQRRLAVDRRSDAEGGGRRHHQGQLCARPAGRHWGTALKQGKGDTALSWEGLRAQWKGQGLDFDYILGRNFSKLPANSFIIRKADFDDAAKKEVYARYLQGWAAGLEFGAHNPRAATQIVMEQFPGLVVADEPDGGDRIA